LSQRFLYLPASVPIVLNRLMVYSSLRNGQETRGQSDGNEAHIREGIAHDLQELRLINGIKARSHVQLDEVHLRASTSLTLDSCEREGKKTHSGTRMSPPQRRSLYSFNFLCISSGPKTASPVNSGLAACGKRSVLPSILCTGTILSHISELQKSPVESD